MKKILYTLLAGAMALSSCSKSDDAPTAPQSEATTFTLSVDGAVVTRATSTITPTRYVMEVYSEDGLTAENVFGTGDAATNHAEITSGSAFTVNLDKTKAYTCLFWADDNATFDATSLKAIGLNAGKDAAEAYHANVAVAKGKNPAVSVTLKRAVAKITLTETAVVKTTDDIALKLSNIYPTFDVLTGAASGTAAQWSKTIKPSATTGTFATLYFFAKADKELSDLEFTYASDLAKTVTNIPVQQNFATSIKGEYSNVSSFTFTVTADDEWETPDNDVEFPKANIGDFYYADKTFSPTYTADAQNPCIGIVFWVDPANGKKGKIVGLPEGTGRWGVTPVDESLTVTGITSMTDGAPATKNLITARKDEIDFATNYAIFDWVYTTVNNGEIDGRWYIPASRELSDLYVAWNGNPSPTADNAARTAFNEKLTTGGGTAFSADSYWSATQNSSYISWIVTFTNGNALFKSKNNDCSVRVVSAF